MARFYGVCIIVLMIFSLVFFFLANRWYNLGGGNKCDGILKCIYKLFMYNSGCKLMIKSNNFCGTSFKHLKIYIVEQFSSLLNLIWNNLNRKKWFHQHKYGATHIAKLWGIFKIQICTIYIFGIVPYKRKE